MNLRLIKANMHETFLHFSKYILSEKGKIERSNCESKVRSISGMRVASHFPSSWQISVTKVLLSQKSLRSQGRILWLRGYLLSQNKNTISTFSYHNRYLHLHYVVLCSNEMVWVGGKRWTFGDFTWVMCGAGGGGPDRLDQPWSPRPLHSGNWGGL